jgi:amino acid transporter
VQGLHYNVLLDFIAPVVAIVICGLTIYWSIYPVPPHPLNEAPWLALGWLVVGVVVIGWMRLKDPERVRGFGRILGDEAPEVKSAETEIPPAVALQ